MPGITDFLFNGSAPEQVTSYGATTTGIPDWFSAYQQGIMAQANQSVGNLVAQGWNPATGQQVAGLTPDQQAAYTATRNIANDPTTRASLGKAQEMTAYIADPRLGWATGSSAAAPYLSQATSLSAAGAGAPSLTSAGTAFNAGANANTSASVAPYTTGAASLNPLAAASPFISGASQSFTDPGVAASYMSPYISNVNDVIAQLGARNLSENILPALNSDFIGAGQYGSSRNQEFVSRAARDTQQAILNQQAQNLNAGYGQAQNAFQADTSRLGALAQTAGGLTQAQQQALINAGALTQTAGAGDINARTQAGVGLTGLGQTAGQLTSTDMSNLLNAANISGTLQNQANQTQLQAAGQIGALGQAVQSSGLQAAQALDLAGQEQQGTQQNVLNANTANALAAQGFTQNQITYLNNILRGQQVPTSTSTVNQGPSSVYSPSVASQLTGLAIAGKYI